MDPIIDLSHLTGRIHLADCFEFIKTIPDDSVDFVMTSPPYWSLRDYDVNGQFGQEKNVAEYVERMVWLCGEVKRILKPTGSFWLNIGDKVIDRRMMCIPWDVALSASSNGLRMVNTVIWRKTNPLPSSDERRLTSTYEYVFHFSKTKDFYADLFEVREPHKGQNKIKKIKEVEGEVDRGKYKTKESEIAHRQGFNRDREATETFQHPAGRNPGDVWDIATASLGIEHFAAYPEKLVMRPILMTCPPKICPQCGTIFKRIVNELVYPASTAGWEGCKCGVDTVSGVGYDPFSGAGTTCLQLKKQNRRWFGSELNPKYLEASLKRIEDEAGTLF
jgi:site-specific DNA-methyltransferase (adenine-specific)